MRFMGLGVSHECKFKWHYYLPRGVGMELLMEVEPTGTRELPTAPAEVMFATMETLEHRLMVEPALVLAFQAVSR